MTLAARPCRRGTWSRVLRVLAPVGRGQMAEDAGPVEQDPQGAPGVLGRGVAGLAGPVRGDQPPLRLVGRPFQAGQRAGEPALDGQDTAASGEARVLAGSVALHDQDVTVLEGLESDRAQE